MHPTPKRQPFRDELLRRVGRNVVNFQFLEATLRSMMPALSNSGTVKEWQARQLAVIQKNKKASFGDLANEFHGQVFRPPPKEVELSDEPPAEVSLSFNFRLENTPEAIAQQKRALIKLVEERNRLIHSELLSVDLDSPEACRDLSAKLDEQNDRIRQQIDSLNSIRNGLRETAMELQRFFESKEFAAMLRGGEEGA